MEYIECHHQLVGSHREWSWPIDVNLLVVGSWVNKDGLRRGVGKAATTEETFWHSSWFVVPARTTSAPLGGFVLDVARTDWRKENPRYRERKGLLAHGTASE